MGKATEPPFKRVIDGVEVELGWGLNYNEEVAFMGFLLWQQSDFVIMPTPEKARDYADMPEAWIDDLITLRRLYEHRRYVESNEHAKQTSPIDTLFDRWRKKKD